MSAKWTWRLAEPADVPAFTEWLEANPQIDAKDIYAGLKKNNPTSVTLVAEKDGVAVAFAPLYVKMFLAHLGLDPEAAGKDKLRALQVLMDGAAAFAVQYGVREIGTLSKEEYPIAQWALKHGFDLESRQLLSWDLNKELAKV